MRIHEYLEIVVNSEGKKVIRCLKCGYELCRASENYKKHCLLWERNLADLPLRSNPTGDKPFEHYQEFICPGCATLLEVDTVCPDIEDEPILWDIQIKT